MGIDSIKKEVVRACRRLHRMGYLAGIGGNIAARISDRLMAVTPSAADYLSMKPEDICILDLHSLNVLEAAGSPTTESGLHALVFRARPDLNASVHTHQPVASAMAILNLSIPLEEKKEIDALGDCVPIVSYRPSGTGMLVRALARTITADRNGYLLRNHGIICGAPSMERAIANLQLIETAAARALAARIQKSKTAQAHPEIKKLALASLFDRR